MFQERLMVLNYCWWRFCHSAEIDRSIYFVRSLADDFVAHVFQRLRRRRRLNIRYVTRSPRAGVLQFKDLIHAPALFYWVLYRLDDSAWQAQVEEERRQCLDAMLSLLVGHDLISVFIGKTCKWQCFGQHHLQMCGITLSTCDSA